MQEFDNEQFPFITGLIYSEIEYYGIVVNHDNNILTMYDYEKIPTLELKQHFIQLGEMWWWESNRQMPIDVFLHYEMAVFKPYLITLIMKDINHVFGPMTSLQNLLKKRIKRRGIQLVRKTS